MTASLLILLDYYRKKILKYILLGASKYCILKAVIFVLSLFKNIDFLLV